MKTLTVSSLYQPRRRGGAVTSHLRLTGRWLEAAGFPAGARVPVQVQQGQLVITAAE
jgi:hypothetical protein